MAEDKEDREEGGFHNPNHNNNSNNISKKGSEVKSCKGYLYYSSLRRSKNPTCVGIPRTLHRGQSLYNLLFLFLFVWFFDSYDDACGSVWFAEKIKEIWRKILGFLFCAVFAYSSLNFDGFFFSLVVMILISLSGSLRWFLVLDVLYAVGWCKVLCLFFFLNNVKHILLLEH